MNKPRWQTQMSAVREFLRPVKPTEIGQAAEYTLAAVRVWSLVVGTSLVAVALTGSIIGAHDWVTWSAIHLAGASGMLLVSLRARASSADRAESLAIALLVLTMATLLLSIIPEPEQFTAVYLPVVPLAMAAFIPVRPTRILWTLPLPLLALPLQVACGAELPLHPIIFAVGTVSMVASAATACQFGRRRWAQLAAAHRSLLANERMSTLGRLTAGIAHELKTPLAAARSDMRQVSSLAEELQESIGHSAVTEQDLREIVAEMVGCANQVERALERSSVYINSIRQQTRLTHAEDVKFKPYDRLREIEVLLAHELRRSAIDLEFSGVDSQLTLVGPALRFDQILTNLVSNSIDACQQSGRGTTIRVASRVEGQRAIIRTFDDGPGIPAGNRGLVFEPLFTTKGDKEGTGLGLAIARDVARVHFRGELVIADVDSGACFELRLPIRGAMVQPNEMFPFEPQSAKQPASQKAS